MLSARHYDEIDYLLIGHITRDISSASERMGGTVAYAALTAKAFGLRPGILTAWAEDLPLGALEGIPIANIGAEQTSTFENQYSAAGRRQRVLHLAPPLDFHQVPENWRNAPIIHLAPVIGEVSPRMASFFKESTLGITPQGWLRELKANGVVQASDWPEADFVLSQADAVVISQEDILGDQVQIERMAANAGIFVVTAGAEGAELYQRGEQHLLPAPSTKQIDPTGAGDIFAAAFFIHLHFGDEALAAAQVATQLAARSVERLGLASTPTQDEILDLISEAF